MAIRKSTSNGSKWDKANGVKKAFTTGKYHHKPEKLNTFMATTKGLNSGIACVFKSQKGVCDSIMLIVKSQYNILFCYKF